jgi:hypothetical protein
MMENEEQSDDPGLEVVLATSFREKRKERQ